MLYLTEIENNNKIIIEKSVTVKQNGCSEIKLFYVNIKVTVIPLPRTVTFLLY